jgi:pyruvate ferredoxin oxidoreductase beta subunit
MNGSLRKMDEVNKIPTVELFAQGHRACSGCGGALAMRLALKASGKNVVVSHATGCMEVISSPFPETAWKVPWIHVAFENAAATASGIDFALKKLGSDAKVMCFGGDGGTFDIGFQALSGAAERGHDICYICYDNGAYMNTGIQRSGATPKYASTTTSPAGKKVHGKTENKKNLPIIMAAHKAYVATANVAYPQDFIQKVKKGLEHPGMSYIQVYAPCPTGWKTTGDVTIAISKLAFQTKVTPLFEIMPGEPLKFSKKPANTKPLEEYLMIQGRFKHMSPEEIAEVQKWVDDEYDKLVKMEEAGIRF